MDDEVGIIVAIDRISCHSAFLVWIVYYSVYAEAFQYGCIMCKLIEIGR